MTIRPSVLEMAKRGAAYHQVGYLTYLHWLIEQTLQDEVRYYGWKVIPGYTILSVPTVSKSDRDKINRLSRNAGRKVEKALKDETKD